MRILVLIAAALLVSSPAFSHSTPSLLPGTKSGSEMLRNTGRIIFMAVEKAPIGKIFGHSTMLADQVLIDAAKNAVLSLANSCGGAAGTYHSSLISSIMSFRAR